MTTTSDRNEPTLQGLSDDLQNLTGNVQTLSNDLQSLTGNVQALSVTVQALSGTVQTLSTDLHGLTGNVQTLSDKVDRLADEQIKFNDRFSNYQQATQWVVQLAFTLIASATITIIITAVLRR